MDPLITNGIDPALLQVQERRGRECDRDPAPRRKRPAVPESASAAADAPDNLDLGLDAPKHALDDLA